MFTESNGDFLDRGWIKETENMTGRTPTRGRPTEKTVKLETCFEYLDTRDDYSVMMMMIFVIFRTVTLTDLLLRSPSFMSNARGPQESPHLSMKVLLTFIQHLLKNHLELR